MYVTFYQVPTSDFLLSIFHPSQWRGQDQGDQKKSPNVYKSCPKMIPLVKWYILTPLQKKLPKNVGDLGKLIVSKGFKKLPKVQ